MMRVKAQGFLNAAEYIEHKFGRDELGNVLRECTPVLRERFTSVIAIDWQEMGEFCDFIETAERVLTQPEGQLAEAIGAAGARANTKGMFLRAAFYIGKPDYLLRRVAGMWRQFNDEGAMTVLEMGGQHARLEIVGVTPPRTTFCSVLTGWVGEISRSLRVLDARVQHSQCRARGGKRCLWDVRGAVAPV
jgi:hypothetical protein